MTEITAYQMPTAELADLEPGQLVRVDGDAFADAGLDDAEMDEETDGEHDYDRLGFILEIHEDDFSWVGEDEDSSVTVDVEDESIYIVGMAPTTAGAHPFTGDVLEPLARDDILGDIDVDPDDAAEEMDDETEETGEAMRVEGASTAELADVSDVPGLTRNQMGLSPLPRSWRDSDKPGRLIAMDAWISMGRSFRGCRRSVVGNIRNPNRFCGAFKDYIYGHPYWREGGG